KPPWAIMSHATWDRGRLARISVDARGDSGRDARGPRTTTLRAHGNRRLRIGVRRPYAHRAITMAGTHTCPPRPSLTTGFFASWDPAAWATSISPRTRT